MGWVGTHQTGSNIVWGLGAWDLEDKKVHIDIEDECLQHYNEENIQCAISLLVIVSFTIRYGVPCRDWTFLEWVTVLNTWVAPARNGIWLAFNSCFEGARAQIQKIWGLTKPFWHSIMVLNMFLQILCYIFVLFAIVLLDPEKSYLATKTVQHHISG